MSEESPYSIIFEEPAIHDIKEFSKSLFKYLPQLTKRIISQLEEKLESLKDFPEENNVYWRVKGTTVYKFIIEERLLILYTLKEKEIHVLTCLRLFRNSKV